MPDTSPTFSSRIRIQQALFASFIFCCVLLCLSCKPASQDKILYNGKIYTMNSTQPEVEAIGVRNGKIVVTGSIHVVEERMSKDAQYIDLKGYCLLPGLIDSHNHAIKGGERLLTAHLNDELLTIEALATFAHDALKSGRGKRGDGLYITGTHSSIWSNLDMLDSLFNTSPYEDIPVMLLGTDGHTAWCNQTLLQLAGIDQVYIDHLPEEDKRSYIGLNAYGEPNGFLAEEAIEKANKALPPATVTAYDGALQGTKHLNSLGITAWLDPSAGTIEEGTKNEKLTAYSRLFNNGELTAHVATTVVANVKTAITPQIDTLRALQKKFTTPRISVLGFKIFADGVLEYPTQTAAISLPYRNSGNNGTLMVDRENLSGFITQADQEKLLVHIHAIGDRAVTVSLDAYEQARSKNKNNTLPHSITHLQLVRPEDHTRFSSLNILPCMQLLWATADQYTEELVKPYIDSTLYKYHYPARSLIQAGATLCGASDWPVSSANPFEAMAVAETRSGSLGVLNATEAVSREDMVKAYTLHAAQAMLMENEIGSIESGKKADFVLIDRDVMTVSSESIRHTKVLWTMFDGEIVYQSSPQ